MVKGRLRDEYLILPSILDSRLCYIGFFIALGMACASSRQVTCLFSTLDSEYMYNIDVSSLSLCGCFWDALCTLPPTHCCMVSNCCNVQVDVLGASVAPLWSLWGGLMHVSCTHICLFST